MVLMKLDLYLCTYDLTSMYFWTLHVYFWVATMLYRFWKGFGFKPHCVASILALFLCIHMAALEALVQEKLKQDKEDKCAKQANRIRLIADPSMSVQGLQVCVKSFLVHKETQDLWHSISPPPGTPSTYGWHSAPHAEWLIKASGLLYELLAVAENSKIHSTKLCKALKALYDQKDLQVPLNHGKPTSVQDELDKYDFTIRVLMSMLRKLRASAQLKANVFRSLCKKDQTVLEILLAKVQLPPEFILDEYVRGEEDGLISQVETHPAPADLGMVVYEPPKVQKTKKCGKGSGFPVLPAIFEKILGKTVENEDVEKETCVEENKKASAEEPIPAPKLMKLPSQTFKKGQKAIQDVLDMALNFIPQQSKKPAPKEKANKKTNANNKKNPQLKKKPAGKAKQAKKTEAEEEPAKEAGQQYQAGDYASHREKYIQKLMKKGKCNWKQASQSWNGSMERATLLQSMSVSELKRRRFISKEEKENPFLHIVKKNKAKTAVDVD